MSTTIDIKALFTAGAHYGHKTSRWHPKMAPYIHSERGGIHIINLEETIKALEPIQKIVSDLAASERQILFASTKQQAETPIRESAAVHNQPYVVNRWMGGLLTNNKTMKKRIQYLIDLEKRMASGELAQRYSKLEVQHYQEEIDNLNEQFGGVKDMAGLPGAIFIVDINRDSIAVSEATKLAIPTIGLVDSNADPSKINHPIPANDDAIKTIELILAYINEAYGQGLKRPKPKAKTEKTPTTEAKKPRATKSPAKLPKSSAKKPPTKAKTAAKAKTEKPKAKQPTKQEAK